MGAKYTRQETRNWIPGKGCLFNYSTKFQLGNKQMRFCYYYLQEDEIILTEILTTDGKIEYYSNPEVYSLAEVSPIISLASKTKKGTYWGDKPFDHIGFCFYLEEELNQLPYYKNNTEAPIDDQPAWYSVAGIGRKYEPSFTIWIKSNADSFEKGFRFVNRLFRLLELQIMKKQAKDGLSDIKGELILLESFKPVAWDW